MTFTFEEDGRYLVRDLIVLPVEDLINSPEVKNITLIFDDGEIPSTSRECIHGRICWDLYSIYPHIVVSKKHHLYSYGRKIEPETTDLILNDINWACVFECHKHGIYPDLEVYCKKVYQITDRFDKLYHELRHFSVFLTGKDFIDIHEHPEIISANEELRQKEHVVPADIGVVYSKISRVIHRDKDYKYYPIVMAARSSSVKIKQLYKNLGPQGILTDVDSVMFRKPVLDSLVTGITSIRDLTMESRSAAMSIFYQKDAMQQSEYLTRMVQLIAECVYRVHPGDCGSRNYVEVPIRNVKDINDMRGIWRWNPETETEEVITKKSLGLINSIVKVRSVLTCRVSDRYGFCSRCYGDLAYSLFKEDNVGHLAGTVIQRIVTQSILSNKHLVASANGELITLSGDDTRFMMTQFDDPSEFYFNPKLAGKKVTISFSPEDAARIQDITFLEDLDSASPMRLTQLETLTFRVYDEDVMVVEYPLSVSSPSQKSFFTIAFLKYIRDNGWSVDPKGKYEVKLDNWDFSTNTSVVGMPMVQYNTPAHMKAIKELLTTSNDNVKDKKYSIANFPNPKAALLALHDLIKLRLSVNFTHVQVIVIAYLCANPDDFDYRIPKLKEEGKLVPYSEVMVHRDIALAMSFQKHYDTFKSMRTHVIDQRHPHPHSNAMRG